MTFADVVRSRADDPHIGLRFEDRQGKEVGDAQAFSIELQSR